MELKGIKRLKSDESESAGALASVLKALRKVHHIFFEGTLLQELEENPDGRDVLKTVRRDVLKGCKTVFSRVFPTQFQADNHRLWRMVEQLGATCSTEAGTEKSCRNSSHIN
ncbi:hypothetical protein NC652_017114 [Populus alba x Populus x berolinensis]|nr:hypothetical protein NC652_017114 [Populus alba x Populus x berolinensis]